MWYVVAFFATLLAAVCMSLATVQPARAASNPIVVENQQPGTTSWQLVDYAHATKHEIEGYASLTSVNQGGTIQFMVSTSATAQYNLDVYRMGWYPTGTNPDGTSCSPSCGGRLMQHVGPLTGTTQATCPQDLTSTSPTFGMTECHWTPSYTLNVPTNWTTGAYLVKLTRLDDGLQNYMTFVVRDDGDNAPVLYSLDVNTWQAYNYWGGAGNNNQGISLYGRTNDVTQANISGSRAYTVSFDRPYEVNGSEDGAGNLMVWDFPMIRWLESQGYNIDFVTDVDLDGNPNVLSGHRVLVNVGHDEYYSDNMKNVVKNGIASGVNMAFFSANDMYSRIIMQPDYTGAAQRRVFDDKNGLPGSTTYEYRYLTPAQPENAIQGVMQNGVSNGRPFLVNDASSWIFNGTGLVNYTGNGTTGVVTSGAGQNALAGLVGYEFDERAVNCSCLSAYASAEPAGIDQVGHSYVPAADNGVQAWSDATLYTAPSGAQVFSAGTIQWAFAVDNGYNDGWCSCGTNVASAVGQKITSNILNRFSAPLTAPQVTLTPQTLAFGSQQRGTSSAAQPVTLKNTGTAALTISGIAVTGTNAGDFSQTNNCPASLAAGSTCTINVSFLPTAAGSRTASVQITDNATDSPESVALSGTGTAPTVALSPTTLTFGSQLVGSTSGAQTVTLTNSGTAPLSITGISVSGASSSDFGETDNCPHSPATLAVNASCTISVTFSPTAAGTRTASVQVADNATGSPQSVSLSGSGVPLAPAVSLAPSSESFGSQLVGTTSAAQGVTLTNTGNTALAISSIALSGTNPGDFTQTNTCPASLGAGASCTISVSFAPTATGSRTATVKVTDNAGDSPESVSLSGTGVSPSVQLSSSSLSFGSQLIGTSSSAQSVTVTNTGTAALSISGIAVSGANAGDFSQTNTCPASLAVNGTCSISVTFSPTAAGSRSASVQITDNAASSPQTVTLGGTGTTPAPAVSLSPSSLSFGSQLNGSTSSAKTVTLTNSGTASLAISSIAVSGTNAGDFAESDNCPAAVAVSATCTISVTFSPSASGSRTASVQITDNAADSPESVSLSGTGVAPAPTVSLSPTSLSFGSQLAGTTSTAQTVTLTNSGTAALSITGISVGGTNGGDFGQTNNCPASLAINASCTISATFTPTATGSRTASVQITDNAAGSPQSVGLSGTGTAPAVSLSSTSLSYSSQLIGTPSSAQSVTVTNNGTAPLSITSIALGGANAGDFSQTNTCPNPPATLAVNATCNISVTFKPTAAGSRVASVQITDNALNSPQAIGLTGTGSTSAISFDKNLGTHIENIGTTTMSLTTTDVASAQSRVVAFVVWAGSRTLTSFAGGGLTWTVDGQAPGPYNDYRVGIVSAYAPSGLPNGTVLTATFSGSVNHGNISAASFLGIATTNPVDAVGSSSQLGVTGWTTGITTTNASDLVVGASIMDALVNNTPTAPNILIHSFQNPNFYSSLTTEYQIDTTAGAKTVNGTWAGTTTGSIENATIAIAYKSQ